MKLEDIDSKSCLTEMCGPNRNLTMRIYWRKNGAIYFDSQHPSENSIPVSEWHGHESTWELPKVCAFDIQAEIEKVQDRIKDLAETYESEWDGNNHIAKFPEDLYNDVMAEIFQAVENLSTAEPCDYWDPYDYWQAYTSEQVAAEIGLTAESTQEEIEDMALEMAASVDIDGVLLDADECEDFILSIQEDLKD